VFEYLFTKSMFETCDGKCVDSNKAVINQVYTSIEYILKYIHPSNLIVAFVHDEIWKRRKV